MSLAIAQKAIEGDIAEKKGKRPLCRMKPGYQYCYLYAALQPFEGHLIALILPDMTKESFGLFMEHFSEQTTQRYGGDKKVLLIADGAGAHQQDAIANKSITLKKLPAASPELNPVERFFEELRKAYEQSDF